MVLPVIKALAVAYPDWDITMLSKKQWASLFLDLPDNVHFFGADLRGKHSGLAGLNRLLHDLKYWEFDAVADLHAVIRTLYLRHRCLWRGKRVAHLHKDRYQKWLLVRHFYQYKHPLQSTVSRYRTVFEELGFEIPLQDSDPILRRRFAVGKHSTFYLNWSMRNLDDLVLFLVQFFHITKDKVILFKLW